MDNVEPLKACPFCGNDGSGPIEDALHISHTQNDWHPNYDCYCVQCDKCTATMGYSASEDEAAEAWNQRTPAPECKSCGGLNTSCPKGCERDPATGELIAPAPARKDGLAAELGDARYMARKVFEGHYARVVPGYWISSDLHNRLITALSAPDARGEVKKPRADIEWEIAANGRTCPHGSTGPCSVCGDRG